MLRAIGARRGPGAALGGARGGRRSASSPPPSASSPASGCRSGCGRCSARSASTSRSGSLVISTGTIVTAFVVGLATSVLSAIVPAVRASRVRPIAALRDVAVDRSARLRRPGRAPAWPSPALGVVGFAAGLTADGKDALPLIGLGAVVIVLGVFVLGPVLVRPAIRLLGAPIARSGVTGAYARENARRTPKRTAATASALMIGVALVGLHHHPRLLHQRLDRRGRRPLLPGRLRRRLGFVGPGLRHHHRGRPAGRAPRWRRCRRCARASPRSTAPTTDIIAVDTAVFDGLYDLEVSAGRLADVAGDGVAVERRPGRRGRAGGGRHGCRSGSPTAARSTSPCGRSTTPTSPTPPATGCWTSAPSPPTSADQFDRQVFVSIDDGVTAQAARSGDRAGARASGPTPPSRTRPSSRRP